MAGICFGQEEKQKTLFVNGKDINKLGLEYIEISCYTTSMYGKNWAVNFDIGEEYVNWKGHRYTDENGNVIDFESPMDAVNFVIKCGWEFVSNNGGAAGNVTNLYYLMRKKKTLIKENP
ncbi:MAG: hypothetical protein DRI89_00260 [Bacteroidetes bacterium]|nr:MAG: hypothetical protein DRI89_00260 [Bacteroidota bacterium]